MKIITTIFATLLSLCACAAIAQQTQAHAEITDQTTALLCVDQDDNRIWLFDPFAADDCKPTLWSYPAEEEEPLKYKPTDAKRVEVDGVVYVLAAYHGRVQLVRFSDRKCIKDFPSYGSCHSAELLPSGAIVTANSNHGMLRLHHSAEDFTDLKLPYAHGVTWDKARNCLWAVGDFLYRLSVAEGKLTIEERFALPLTPTGHELFPLREEAKLLVSNNHALFLFDIASKTFESVSDIKGIKSASQHRDGTIWAMHPTAIKGGASWQSDTVLRVCPQTPEIRHSHTGSKFYKLRWWQRVSFSY